MASDPFTATTCRELVEHFESCHLTAYLCPAGVPTIGLGSTGWDVAMGMTWTQAQCNARCDLDIARARNFAARNSKSLTGIKLEAIEDFCYNVGNGAYKSSTLRQRINSGDWQDVPAQLRRWVRGGGKVLRGLVRRREAEVTMWLR